MGMCVISACKSAIVSPYTPACNVGHSEFTCVESSACVVGRICLTSEPDCILHLYHYRSDRAVTMMIPG